MMRSIVSEEMVRGQLIIVLARWLLVLAGLVVALWEPQPLPQLRLQIGTILLVAIGNFFLHAQLLRRRPTLTVVAYAASLLDLLVIFLLTATEGANANVFVFFFPAVLAISVAFPTQSAAALSAIGIGLYALLGLVFGRNEDVVLARVLMLAGVAVIGNAYWRLHRTEIQPTSSPRREAAQDLFFGQVATLWARWFVIVGGALLVLSRATTAEQLALGIAPVVVLLVVNFALHGRYLIERPANQALTLLASGLDLVVASMLFIAWSGAGGVANPIFVFFYPLVFAFALVFPPRLTVAFTTVSLVVYGLLVLSGGVGGMGDVKQIVVRALTLAAVGALGTVYWRMVRREERHAEEPNRSVTWRPAEAG